MSVQDQEFEGLEEVVNLDGAWTAEVDISRTPSPGIPAKRMKMTFEDIVSEVRGMNALRDGDFSNLMRTEQTPEALGYDPRAQSWKEIWFTPSNSSQLAVRDIPADLLFPAVLTSTEGKTRKKRMQTGCIPCLTKGVACDPENPECKLAISDDWNLNYDDNVHEEDDGSGYFTSAESMSLTVFRPDIKWRRNWRERHSLNFFVNFSAPQMAGFFDSTFWQRMVIQTSYHEPAILHAITAIGALHECIMQRAFADEKRKARAIEFALNQCNRAISCLTSRQAADMALELDGSQRVPNSRLALTTCVLFTCFEAMQGRCDSAVNHALQGRRLLQATGRPNVTSMTPAEEDDLEQMRPIVERLEVQATALLDKGRRPEVDTSDQTPPLPPIEFVFSLDHAHNTLHTALNSVMRFMQGFHPTAPRDHIAVTMAEKYLRYAPWFAKWEAAFTTYLADGRESMTNMDLKRAMVLKANHLVGTMLASVDQSAGPVAYDAYEAEFRAIVDLAREVLASFSCPPLPTLTGGSSGTPYLSFSLWVTDPLWMAISRCRNPSIRQAAFTLLSQNPRQEGIWHAGPQLTNQRYMRKVEPTQSAAKADATSGTKRKNRNATNGTRTNGTNGSATNGSQTTAAPSSVSSVHEPNGAGINGDYSDDAQRSASYSSHISHGSTSHVEDVSKLHQEPSAIVRTEWVDLRDRIQENADGPVGGVEHVNVDRYESACTGRCSIPSLNELESQQIVDDG